MTAATRLSVAAQASGFPPVLVFERSGHVFCCPFADVEEILDTPTMTDAGLAVPLLAGLLLHRDRFIPAVDPAGILDLPLNRSGLAILLAGAGRSLAVLADVVVGFRVAINIVAAPWIPPGRIVRKAAVLDRIGQALVVGADGIADVPAVPAIQPSPAGTGDATEPATAAPGSMVHLVYTVGGRRYASAYSEVSRIMYRQPLFRIPAGRAPMRYAVEMSGSIVPVLELPREDRSFASEAESDSFAAPLGDLVVLNSPTGPLALRVDCIERPLALTPDGGDPSWFAGPGVAGIARLDDRPYAVITGAALLRDLGPTEAP